MPYTGPIYLSGDMIGSTVIPPANTTNALGQTLNPGDEGFGMQLTGVTSLGTESTIYRLVWTQNVNVAENEFDNGQLWTLQIYDGVSDTNTLPNDDPDLAAAGWTTVFDNNMGVRDDFVSGVASGDEYIMFTAESNYLIYDINGGFTPVPTDYVYLDVDRNGDPAAGDEDFELDFSDAIAAYAIPCFASGTFILTSTGLQKIEDLAVGELVETVDHGPQPIRWIGSRALDQSQLATHTKLKPIRIKAGALGCNTPTNDLVVSPQHRILVQSTIAQRMFGAIEVLVAAKQLLGIEGIDVADDIDQVEYFHILFDQHQVVYSNGAKTETLFTGSEALKAIGQEARNEIFTLFPDLAAQTSAPLGARTFATGRNARKMAERHTRNHKSLVT